MRRSTPIVKTAAALAAALVLPGCASLAPAYRRPAAPVPATFPTGDAYAHAPPAAGPAAIAGWRTFFTDPRLRDIIDLALRNNRDLRVAILNIAEARQQVRVQAGAQLPAITGSAGGLFEHEPTDVALGSAGSALGGASAPKGGVNFQDYTASIGVSDYELDLWGRVRSLKTAALEQFLASVEARRETQITLISEVATDVLAYAADRQRLMVAQETRTSDQNALDLANARFRAGVASLLDVRQAQTTLEQAQTAVAAQTTQAAQDLNALTLVVGAPVRPELLPNGQDNALSRFADVPVGLESDVLLGRPDVLQAEHQLQAATANIGAARAAFFPTLVLTGSGGRASLNLAHLFNEANGAWLFQPNLTLPIFDGGANLARLRSAKAQRAAAVAAYEKTIQSAFREVADALAQRGTIDMQLAAQERLVAAAQSTYDLSLARYRRGADSFLNTLTAQLTLYNAQQGLITTRLTRDANAVALYRALGGGAQGADAST